MTGAAGFLGRHFVAELQGRGYQVARCDVTLGWDALDLFRDEDRFDLVVHAAAREPHRAAIDGKPAGHVYNQLLDAAMFDWAIRTGQGRVLYLSSSAAYPVVYQGSKSLYRLRESHITEFGRIGEPDSAYGWTKLTGERMAASARAAGVPVTVVRPFSGYGEDQGTDWPFGAFLARARAGADPFEIWGDGGQVRDWIHVDDVVRGALAVVDAGTDEPVNLCTGIGTSCGDLAAMVTEAAGYSPEFQPQGDKPAGVAYRVGDPARLHRYYTPKVSLAEGIARALA